MGNKEKQGKTIRLSIRIPKEVHNWVKSRSENTKGINYTSMNKIITEAIIEYMKG